MSAIGTLSQHAGDTTPLLLANSSDGTQAADGIPAPDPTSTSDRGPATRVDLSDQVKDILARASSDRDVADRLKALVERLRSGSADASAQDTSASQQSSESDVNRAFEQLSGGTPAEGDSQEDQPAEVPQDYAAGFTAGRYTISAVGRAGDAFSTFTSLGAGATAQEYQRGTTDYITFSQSEAATASVAVSSDAGVLSATSSATQSASVTFAVDFSTGAVSIAQSELTSISTAIQIAAPGSAFSTLA